MGSRGLALACRVTLLGILLHAGPPSSASHELPPLAGGPASAPLQSPDSLALIPWLAPAGTSPWTDNAISGPVPLDALSPCPSSPWPGRALDGMWYDFDGPSGWGSTALYDPTRRRMIVVGGDVTCCPESNDIWALSLEGEPRWQPLMPFGESLPGGGIFEWSGVYDPLGDRAVIVRAGAADSTGTARAETWQITFGSVTRVSRLDTAADRPVARSHGSAVLDTRRNRVLMFGGITGSYCRYRVCVPGGCWCEVYGIVVTNETLGLSLSEPAGWTRLSTSDLPPLPRAHHGAVYDPVRDRMIVFGGYSDWEWFRDVWALNLTGVPRWERLEVSGSAPPDFSGATPVYDPIDDRILVLSHFDNRAAAWSLQLGGSPQWVRVEPAGAVPNWREGSAAILDPLKREYVIFGGQVYGVEVSQAWRELWTLALGQVPAWRRVGQRFLKAPPRFRHDLVWDPVRQRALLIGGERYTGQYEMLGDTWQLEAGHSPGWAPVAVNGDLPGAGLADHAAVFDPVRDRVVVFGGQTAVTPLSPRVLSNQIWALELSGGPTWRNISAGGQPPVARSGHSAIYDEVGDRIIIFAGRAGSVDLDDLWELSLSGGERWARLSPAGPGPPARALHRAVYDRRRQRMILFGGVQNEWRDPLGDLWALELEGELRWTLLTPAGPSPGTRHRFSATLDDAGDRMLVMGGASRNDASSCLPRDVWSLTLGGSPQWTQLAPTGRPPWSFWGQDAVMDPTTNRLVVFGGSSGSNNETWALDFSTPVQPISVDIRPGSRENPVNPDADGTLPVALLSSRELDAAEIDLGRTSCAGAGILVDGRGDRPVERRDVDGDGRVDVVVHFDVRAMQLGAEDTAATVRGVTLEGLPVRGTDRVRVVPSRRGAREAQASGRSPKWALALRVPAATPVRGDLVVFVTLPDATPARLELFDVAGRCLQRREIGHEGQGEHQVRLAERGQLAPGVYWLRLVRSEKTLTHRIAVLD